MIVKTIRVSNRIFTSVCFHCAINYIFKRFNTYSLMLKLVVENCLNRDIIPLIACINFSSILFGLGLVGIG